MSVPSSPGAIHGDWVLFHPVYEPGEVDAVKVSDSRFSCRCDMTNIINVKVIHRKPTSFQDKIARGIVKLARQACRALHHTIGNPNRSYPDVASIS
jgi:hypothetical protein